MIHDRKQAAVDIVTLRQSFVEVHAAHHSTQVGRRDLHDRVVEVRHFISRLGRVQHLEKNDSIHADHRVVAGNDFLPRNIKDLFHDIDLASDAVKKRDDDRQAGLGRIGVAAKTLDCVNKALLNHRNAHHHKYDDDKREQAEKIFHAETSRL